MLKQAIACAAVSAARVQIPDDDIATTLNSIADTEKVYGEFIPVKDYTGVWRVGKENLLQTHVELNLESDPICSSSGCDQYKHPDSTAADWPKDYGVPSFGMDREVSNSLTNLGEAEKIVGKHWSWEGAKYKNPAKKVNYNFAMNLDGDIVDAQKNLASTEAAMDHQYNLIQLESDPICSSAGCDQYKHPDSTVADWPKDYPVPAFGMDRGIQHSLQDLAEAEKIVGHHWTWEGDKYKNPAKKAMYNFAMKLDGDIIDSQANLAAAEASLDHPYELS